MNYSWEQEKFNELAYGLLNIHDTGCGISMMPILIPLFLVSVDHLICLNMHSDMISTHKTICFSYFSMLVINKYNVHVTTNMI